MTLLNNHAFYALMTLLINYDFFTIYIPDIYPAELRLNKANNSDKETSFLDLNIKVIGSDVYDKRNDLMTLDFLL